MQRMLISVDRDESRAAVVDDGRLTHLEIEPVNHDSVKGNIYRGVVARVEPSLQSAFIDFGRAKQGFLPVGEIHRHLRKEGQDKRTPIQDILKAGQELVVQVVRDEIGNKGATLSTYVSLPGRYLVLMPRSDKSGVSRKLSDTARMRVKELTESMTIPDGFGLIVRTSGETATKLQLTRDLVYLNRLWTHIQKESENGSGAAPLYLERSLPIRFVRDYFTKDIEELVIDDEYAANEVGAYLKLLMPRTLRSVERYSGAMPLFARYGILSQVQSVFARQVPLAGGGSIVIDQTEALVAIDVNSGRVKGKDIEDTARATNIEAAREIARQLVLRDLGGLVVCDFIDMRDRKAVREVESTLKAAMKKDKARHKLGRISEFGLLELSRQRLKSAVHRGAFVPCPHCSGTSRIRTVESLTSSIIRRIYELITQRPVRHVIALVPPEAATFLLNQRRRELAAVETEYGIGIEIVPMEGMTAANVMLEHFEEVPSRGGMEKLREHRLRRVTQHLDLVRNRVIKRDEHDVERRVRRSRAAAMIDWGKVYSEVEEETVDVKDTAPKPRKQGGRKPNDRVDGGRGKTTAKGKQAQPSAPAPSAVADTEYPPLPTAKPGFTGWIKNLFGLGEVSQAASSAVVEVAAAPQLPPAEPSEQDVQERQQSRDDERPRRRRRRRGRGKTGPRDQQREAREQEDEQKSAPREVSETETGDEENDAKPRRRRRRRRRRGRGNSETDSGDMAAVATRGDSAESSGSSDDAAEQDARSAPSTSSHEVVEAATNDASDTEQVVAAPVVEAASDASEDVPTQTQPAAEELADVTSLARQEIERLRAASGVPPLPVADPPSALAEDAGTAAADEDEDEDTVAVADATPESLAEDSDSAIEVAEAPLHDEQVEDTPMEAADESPQSDVAALPDDAPAPTEATAGSDKEDAQSQSAGAQLAADATDLTDGDGEGGLKSVAEEQGAAQEPPSAPASPFVVDLRTGSR